MANPGERMAAIARSTDPAVGRSPTAPQIDALIAEGYERQIVLNDKLVVLVRLMKHGNFQAHVEAIILVHSLPTRGQAVTEAEMQSAVIHGAIKRFVNDQFVENAFGPHVRKMDKVEIEEACEKMFQERCTQALKTAVIGAFAKSGRTILRTTPKDIKRKLHSKARGPRSKKNSTGIGNPLRKNGEPMYVEPTPQSRLPVIPEGTESTNLTLSFDRDFATIVLSDSEARND